MLYSVHLKAVLFYLLICSTISAFSQDWSTEIYRSREGAEMEEMYSKIKSNSITPKRLDEIRSHIAMQYAFENRLEKATMFINSINSIPLRANRYFILARNRFQLKDYQKAQDLADNAYHIALIQVNEKYPDLDLALQPAAILIYTTTLLTEIFMAQESYPEAIAYIDKSFALIEKDSGVALQLLKATLLEKQQQYNLALESYMYVFKNGSQSDEIKNKLRELYRQCYPADSLGFERYLADVVQKKRIQFLDSIRYEKKIEKAPDFKLKNMDGHTVSLKDLKGKIVILDFWATWCTPCKASFPAMQKAVNRYKDNPDIVFLFVNTWERNEQSVEEGTRYMKENQYTFNVLFDLQYATNRYQVVEAYNIKGLPNKIFIDKNGYIRCRLTGFNGNNEETLEEITELIEIIG